MHLHVYFFFKYRIYYLLLSIPILITYHLCSISIYDQSPFTIKDTIPMTTKIGNASAINPLSTSATKITGSNPIIKHIFAMLQVALIAKTNNLPNTTNKSIKNNIVHILYPPSLTQFFDRFIIKHFYTLFQTNICTLCLISCRIAFMSIHFSFNSLCSRSFNSFFHP